MGNRASVFKFADVEVREREFCLVKAGEVLPVEPKTFRVLLFLLKNPQKLIAKEELLNAVWGDAAVTDSSLTRTIAQLRRLLGDEIRNPRYIETVATVGYRFLYKVEVAEDPSGNPGMTDANVSGDADIVETPESGQIVEAAANPPGQTDKLVGDKKGAAKQTGARRNRVWKWLLPGAAFLVVGLAVAVWYLRRPLPPPSISEFVRITHDGHGKVLSGTDGNRLYLQLFNPPIIAQVAIAGGQIAPIAVPVNAPHLLDVSPDGSTLLVGSFAHDSIWTVGVLDGSPRRLAKDEANGVAWSPDGKSLAYSTLNGEIYKVRSDWSEVQKLASVEDQTHKPASNLAWSPDGATVRFTSDYQLWEISSRGSSPRRLLPDWNESARLCCGHWTPDGAFFLFLSGDSLMRSVPSLPGAQLWALDERRGLLRKPSSQPIQLTSGPTRWGIPFPSKDGTKIFASGVNLRGELERFDSKSNQFQPFLGGISAEFVSFSKDGKSVAYVSFPEGILWKANRDGSSPVQLTDPPTYPKMTRWSPDGSQILFLDNPRKGNPVTYLVSSEGGKPQRLLPEEKRPVMDANWSPDGRKVVFASCECTDTSDGPNLIKILDLGSHQVTKLPGSDRMWSPRWSPDGRFIAALSSGGDPRVYDLETKQWSVLLTGNPVNLFPTFSHDSRWIYFLGVVGHRNVYGVFRIPVRGGKVETISDLGGLPITGWLGIWMGLDPTDAPLILRNVGSEDIYALTLQEK